MQQDVEKFFETNLLPSQGGDRQLYEVRYAAAALLIACAKSDFEEDPDEEEVIVGILRDRFEVDEELLDRLVEFADAHTGTMGLETFTRLVNKHYTEGHKLMLIEDLWRVAFADGRIDKYEDMFIYRVAGMLDISREQVQSLKAVAGQ
ncbi:MAG: TerB family tellurite resistance protein [Pseudomonadales bacterium]|jgi:uncharacterized tellurite resistance protein B-like protein|nr:TerB family tellurite resistance protein [Pseudomonadales bacterium]